MPIHINARLFAAATGQDYQTASRRLRHRPHISGENGTHFFLLSRVLPLLKRKEDSAFPALFHAGTPMATDMPPDATEIAAAIDDWMMQTGRAEAAQRLSEVQRAYSEHISHATDSSLLCRETERLRRLLILDDQIAAYVLTGNRTTFPSNFRRFALEFALTHTPQKEYA